MKVLQIFLLCSIFLSCGLLKKDGNSVESIDTNESRLAYEIKKVRIASGIDTLDVHELRVFKIRSAMDASAMMYREFGEWSKKVDSKYQDNIKQFLWVDIELLEDQRKFMVAADGIETMQHYFASFVIYDNNNQDCLAENHPDREEIIQFVLRKIKRRKAGIRIYKLLKQNSINQAS